MQKNGEGNAGGFQYEVRIKAQENTENATSFRRGSWKKTVWVKEYKQNFYCKKKNLKKRGRVLFLLLYPNLLQATQTNHWLL